MKRVKCPKCDNYIVFDETKYGDGQQLVFQCPNCKKEFAIRIGLSRLTAIHQERHLDEHQYDADCGSIVVVENCFAFKQVIPLSMGENKIGRYLKGTSINKPIQTRDPSVDTFHCAITVKHDTKHGGLRYVLRDAPSNTGTFVHNTILRDCDRLILHDGDVVTIGATTLILRTADSEANQ